MTASSDDGCMASAEPSDRGTRAAAGIRRRTRPLRQPARDPGDLGVTLPTFCESLGFSSCCTTLRLPSGFLPPNFQRGRRYLRSRISTIGVRQMFSSKRSTVIAAGAAAALIAAVAACGSSASGTAASGSTPASAAASSSPDGGPGSGGAANARSGPAAGGSAGTITSVSTTGFTLTTAAGEKVTVTEASATTYPKGTSTATAAATGQPALVPGPTDSTTIPAAQIIVQPPATSGSNPGGQVISFTKGKQGSTTKVGQIPADYTQGTGTLVSGTTADKAIEAALAAYPGGVVDRVVALGG